MRRVNIACIGRERATRGQFPILLRRIVSTLAPDLLLSTPETAIHVDRSKIVKAGELERYVALAAAKNGARGAILILMDADDDCPATLAPQLLRRAQAARSDMPIAVVLAQKEYEGWFLAAARSLRG